MDNLGQPVPGATVTGDFTGDITDDLDVMGGTPTDIDGQTVLTTTTDPVKGRLKFGFCVDDVAHATLTYNSSADVETCPSN